VPRYISRPPRLRFRFYLKRGSLYAFWVSPDESGASLGYVAAGGPGFTGPRDTVGMAAYQAAEALKAQVHYTVRTANTAVPES
jgi:hypothetical protein